MNPFYALAFNLYAKNFAKHCKENDEPRLARLVLPENVESEEYFYGEQKDQDYSYFVFHPKGKDSRSLPLIIDIHGGGWVYGDKELNRPFCMVLASFGYTVLDFSYPLLPKVHNLEQIQCLVKGIRFAYDYRDEQKISFEKVFLTGDSAGGMMAAILCATGQNDLLKNLTGGGIPCKVDGLVLNHPGGYTRFMGDQVGMKGLVKTLVNHIFAYGLYGPKYKKSEYYQLVSDFDVLAENVKFPKTMVITSKKDDLLRESALRQAETLKRQGVDVTLFDGTEDPSFHVFNVAEINAPSAIFCNESIHQFLQSIDFDK